MQQRIEKIDQHVIHIIDDAVEMEQVKSFYAAVKNQAFTKTEKSIREDDFPIFSLEFVPEKFETTPIGFAARQLLEDCYQNKNNFRLYRSYINLSTYGDVQYPHRDCSKDKDDVTVLYYVNAQWAQIYGGETIFYSNKDSRISILPKPGRIVIFPGSIEHIGGVPTRLCSEARLSLALKYTRNQ